MISRIRITLVCTVLLLGVQACGKKPPSTKTLFHGSFPASIGTQWVYASRETTYYTKSDTDPTLDSANVEIGNNTFSTTIDTAGGRTFLRHINMKGYAVGDTSTSPFSMSGDTLRWYEMGNVPLVFPLAVGRVWTYPREYPSRPGTIDTVKVVRTEKVTVPAGTYDSAFVLREGLMGLSFRADNTWWIVPNIGVVRHESHLPFQHVIQELAEFHPVE